MPEADLRDLMAATLGAPRWDDVAGRCLTRGNCTMVCPTCFCTTTEDVTDLTGDHAERWRVWDSCFDLDFSQLHGGPVRSSSRRRHRQWMTRECLALAEALGQLPQRLAVHAMEVAKVALGASLSEAARPVLPDLVDRAAASLRQAHEPAREQ
jgi:hypothetical protein